MEVSSYTRYKRARRSPEYPCVSRLRHRRLLAFLQRGSSFFSTFNAFVQETSVFFSVAHLKHLVFLGQWDDAINYVHRFAPSVEMLGYVGHLLLNVLHTLKVLNRMATGSPRGVLLVEVEHCFSSLRKYPDSHLDAVKLNKMFLAMHRSKQLRASISWHHVRYKAAEIVQGLIAKTSEFNDLLRLPDCRDRPHDILPIGSCSSRRHHIKERSRIPAADLARFYLQKKRSLPSSSQCEGTSLVSGEPCKASLSTWLVDIVDESVKAGIRRRAVRQEHPFEDPCNEASRLDL
ncbi:uncharacterized protein LOC125532237 isoform X2 [Triticum urartu]|uniref:uncharacterized protein LOC125532237 isoform X2 n=1 Tax=Triticum urartu TaxID=4572 RepID=UPI002042D82B|nr:uncharacterized protein LOC125532237 isoform X2 [Triticum urartu]